MSLQFSSVARTDALYDRVRRVIPPIEWPAFAGDIEAITVLKRRRNAVFSRTIIRRRKSSTASPTWSATAWRWRGWR